jgi:effector-binding domain-containing protein
MSVKNRLIIIFFLIVSGVLVWYLSFKENDYIISFKVKAATGTVFQGINEWSALQLEKEKENYKIVTKDNFDFIKQRMTKGKSQMEYTWEMVSINDSTTKVNVGIKEIGHGLYNKITAPFWDTPFKKAQIKKITSFKDGLNDHIAKFNYKIDGEGSSKEEFVAYLPLKSELQTKAQTMIGNDSYITGYLRINKIKIIGRPYVEVTSWDFEKETLEFNYCFPIDKNSKYIVDKEIKFKTIPVVKGLKATYYGNMRTSDRSWFALLDYAKKNGYELNNKPLEHFFANPFDGGDELTWKTEVIIPFKEK